MDTVTVMWGGRPVQAANPAPIGDLDVEFGPSTVRRTEQAAAAVQRAGDRASGALEVSARLLLRSEGLASSAIEGLRASARDVALAESSDDVSDVEPTIAAWVADNLAVVADALSTTGPLREEDLFAWHRRLMRHSPTIGSHHVGAYRDTLGWIGGADPHQAVHVAVPADAIAAHIADLIGYLNRTDVDPIIQAAVGHAQFETIHPFADGNGRLGRVLIGLVLARRLDVTVPPPVSWQFARDVGGYGAGLTLYRQGLVEQWVGWFADAVRRSAEHSTAVLGEVDDLRIAWRGRLSSDRADAASHRLVEQLVTHPVMNAEVAAAAIDVSRQAALGALKRLAELGIVEEIDDVPRRVGRPVRWWGASDLFALLGR